ncbi:CpaD family pilus assembly lipoprotein [Kiloniella laminariae]|uniref:CpaD family pilus assembly lipoprotein n=1 Tax=Kiloniella laminariae TaxID=454162 RepID=A0ABT4LNN9_9PROT|nr:CpaD family pilus assembly lipoprotein [Kiloniella laminariae]MCZ4281941.1 CpaD family pilus assembly lipoprotein [Kiloniella laminariae]
MFIKAHLPVIPLSFSALAVTLLFACTSEQGYQTISPEKQIVQAGTNFMDTGRWRPLPSPQRAKSYSYIASEGFFIPAQDQINITRLQQELQDVVRRYNITSADELVLDGLYNTKGKKTPESQQAISIISRSLTEMGLNSSTTSRPVAILDPIRYNSAILIHRKIIVAPDCHVPVPPEGARPHRGTFGCSQEANLANMVVSPEALDGSRPLSSPDSTSVTLGIDRYRRGEVKALTSDLATTSGTSLGGQSNNNASQ